ncbi:uncharacterized protein EAE97_001139 [Botrytis byssoidea]|uniref:Uncharacterized protein n=1 Tax=Botrytis byssoidea TaxID=139641 RepID=A0A9P5M8C2_9HELO|nr:uncharacterized protein EAE97_001139 [Botrytis byssoidea]KAF7953740.1 hypothetical protein EAE97_001139 [Botrytis byssoidea]
MSECVPTNQLYLGATSLAVRRKKKVYIRPLHKKNKRRTSNSFGTSGQFRSVMLSARTLEGVN